MANKKITDLLDSGQPIDDNTLFETAEQTAPSTILSFKASFAKLKIAFKSYFDTIYAPIGGGGGGTWGSITGTLSSQTDLQSALDTKLNKSGSNADQDIDIGSFGLNAKHLKVTGTAGAGHIGLKHQSSNITASASESSIGANSSGNPVWKNDGNAIQSIMLENIAITGATKTKVTYDSKGLVTSGADATTADISDSTNKRYVTDAQLTAITTQQITITTSVNITTATTDSGGVTQNNRHVIIDNSTNAISFTLNGSVTASYLKHGTGAITVTRGSGRQMYYNGSDVATATWGGAVGSTLTITAVGTRDYISIVNI